MILSLRCLYTPLFDIISDRSCCLVRSRTASDENGVLRQELGESILRQAVELTLQEDHAFASYKITLELVYRNGQWWVMPSSSLTDIVAGVTTP